LGYVHPDEGLSRRARQTFRVGGVLDIYNSSFLGQPLVCGNVTGALQVAIVCDANGKFGYMLQDKAAATTIKVIESFREVGGDFLQV